MKELKFQDSLNDRINASKTKSNLEDLGDLFKLFLVVTISVGLGASCILASNILLGIVGVISIFGILGGIEVANVIKRKRKKNFSKDRLFLLEKELQQNGINVNAKALQESLITESKIKTESTDRNGKISTREEIIKRFYLLDNDEQIRVLQETLNLYESSDKESSESKSLVLLEEEDLKDIEMPETVKVLKFNK